MKKALTIITILAALIMILVAFFWDKIKEEANTLKEKIMVQFKSNTNNPFNIRANEDNNWNGKTTLPGAAFESFDTIEHGIRAGIKILKTYFEKYDLNTVSGIISRFAPDTENNTKAYIDFVSKKLGVDPYETLSDDKETLWELSQAVCAMENGYQLNREEYEKAWEMV